MQFTRHGLQIGIKIIKFYYVICKHLSRLKCDDFHESSVGHVTFQDNFSCELFLIVPAFSLGSTSETVFHSLRF